MYLSVIAQQTGETFTILENTVDFGICCIKDEPFLGPWKELNICL